MIVGIGTDLVEIRRLEPWLIHPRLLSKYFSRTELDDVRLSHHPAASLAARFAAKEAFGKALGSGLFGLSLRDIGVARSADGQPYFVLEGTALNAMRARRATPHLSLSHEAEYALAFVVLEA